MRTGKTESGFAFEVDENVLGDIRLIDDLALVEEGNVTSISRVVRRLLGDKQRNLLYKHLEKDGVVSTESVALEIVDIIKKASTKN